MTDNAKLCELCRLVISTTDIDVTHGHHASAREICASAQGGCPLCTLVWDSITYHRLFRDPEYASYRDSVGITFGILDPQGSDTLNYHFAFSYLNEAHHGNLSSVDRIVCNIMASPVGGEFTLRNWN
jgi:hypothetical protein